MASSNIKLFDENKGNMLSDSEFSISNQRMNGLQTGVASSQLQNKAMYQASLVAYAIAQVMMQNGKNANDTDAVSAFVANLSGTMLQKVYDIATTAEAQAGVATGKWMSPALVKAAIDTLAAKAQNILSNETKASLGLSNDAVPNDAFVSLKTLVSDVTESVKSKAQIVTGTYTGTGDTKAKKTLTFPFVPKLLFISSNSTSYYSYLWVINFGGASYGIAENSSNSKASLLNVTFNGSQASWTPRDSVVGLDWSGYTYRYVAIG